MVEIASSLNHANIFQDVLKEDKDHYMAHLLIGKAYTDVEKATAETYLRQAVALTSDPLIPYQGLAKCVEQAELPKILHELIKLQP